MYHVGELVYHKNLAHSPAKVIAIGTRGNGRTIMLVEANGRSLYTWYPEDCHPYNPMELITIEARTAI